MPRPFYNLVSTMKPTFSNKVTEFFSVFFHKPHRHSGERVFVYQSKIMVTCGETSLVVLSNRAQITKLWGSSNLVQSSRHLSIAHSFQQSCREKRDQQIVTRQTREMTSGSSNWCQNPPFCTEINHTGNRKQKHHLGNIHIQNKNQKIFPFQRRHKPKVFVQKRQSPPLSFR